MRDHREENTSEKHSSVSNREDSGKKQMGGGGLDKDESKAKGG